MRYMPNAITRKVARQVLLGKKRSPAILFAVGLATAVTSTVLACRATLKVEDLIEKTDSDIKNVKEMKADDDTIYPEKEYQRDTAYIYTRAAGSFVKLYGPSVAVGMISVACLTGSHKILTGRNAALTAAYAALEQGFNEYRRRVVDEYGSDKDRDFRYGSEIREFVEETKQGPKVVEAKRVGPSGASVYARFFDEYSSSWSRRPEYNLLFLRCQQNYANDMLRARGHVFLNEVYDMLGVDRSQAGSVVGWVITKDGSGDNFIDFGVFDGDNPRARDFVNGREGSILLDFNVDGVIYDKI